MGKLFGLLGVASAIAIGIGVFFWRKGSTSLESTWNEAKDTTTSRGKTAADEAEKAVDKITGAATDGGKKASDTASQVADTVKGSPA